jgi:hypothetical protein
VQVELPDLGWGDVDVVGARERFPDDAGFLFARGLANEQVLHHYVYTRAVVRADPRRRVAVLIDGPGGKPLFSYIDATTRDLNRRAIHPATAAFERLARGASDYRDRAVLHLGTLKVYLERTDEAIDLWQSVSDSSPDADVRFLASLFLGRALWEQHRPRVGSHVNPLTVSHALSRRLVA